MRARWYLLVPVVLLVVPGGAQAATVRVSSSDVIYRAATGERNALIATHAGNGVVELVDSVAITPGAGCARPAAALPTRARCTVSNAARARLRANVRDRDDTANVFGIDSRLQGGTGDDTLTGGSGDDVFDEGRRSSGSDTLLGGGGTDEVSYAKRRRKVRADLEGGRDDGQAGEEDRIGGDVENLTGGRKADRLTGNGLANVIRGRGASDRIKGRGGNDVLSAGGSADEDTHARTRDRFSGGSGDDLILGSWGVNRILGGSGRDTIDAGASADRIRVRDGEQDRVDCGAGADVTAADAIDVLDNCEE